MNLQEPLGKGSKNSSEPPLTSSDHANTTRHPTSVDIFSIVGRESHNFTRTIKEAMFISVNDSSLNEKCWKIPTNIHNG